MIDLTPEFLSGLDKVTLDHLHCLQKRYKVPVFKIGQSSATWFGVERIKIIGDTYYEPSEDGFWAVIMVTNLIMPEGVEDLIAFRPCQPDRWWLRLDNARWLGEWEVSRRCLTHFDPVLPPYLGDDSRTDEPLWVFENPLDWWKSGCIGVVPLNREAYSDLDLVQTKLKFTTKKHRDKARHWIRNPYPEPPLPSMSVEPLEVSV